jgi:hypothetical protein
MSLPPANSSENRLARETSPYLLQHRHNPVDWWPWGPDALAEAKRAPTSTRSTCPRFTTSANKADGR